MYHVRLFFVTPGANISPPWTSINTWKMIHFLKISFRTSPPFFGLTFVHSRRRKKGWRLNKKCELKAPLRNVYYLVVEPTHLTNIRQNGNLTQNRGEHKKIETTTPSLLCNQTNPRSFKSNKPIVPLLVQYPVVAAPPPFPKLNARSSPRRPSRLLDGLDGGLPGLLERSPKKKQSAKFVGWMPSCIHIFCIFDNILWDPM